MPLSKLSGGLSSGGLSVEWPIESLIELLAGEVLQGSSMMKRVPLLTSDWQIN